MSDFNTLIQDILNNQQDEIIFLERSKLAQIEQGCKDKLNTNQNVAIINVRGDKLDSAQALFTTFNETLQFVDYFGNNWDAFNDVLGDYPGQAKINHFNTIIVNNINLLQSRNSTYFDILKENRQRNANCRIYILAATADKNKL
ncbi:predicted protein [Naegleria gruberi]|uniref:Predicted protein n=1 Tax=Naegleria gruberi TaxID=5762 RepID=D2V8V9_NAEGR|nr:uncharacterized protein NAEGRDRAFT_65300 [Naegleria gruberi]EFC46869.1 predicted protein [Naegleria gruberi]|eukprot:XP_002679613.1 predicted protein [Naegleria gruberi strain NEG-M]